MLVVAAGCGRIGFGSTVGVPPDAGTPTTSCPAPPYPDVSAPDHVIPCTEQALRDALTTGGVIAFDCATSIPIASELVVAADAVIYGPGVTLDALGNGRVLHTTKALTLIGLTITNGVAAGTGGGVYVENGSLLAIDSAFVTNHGPMSDPVSGGGAIGADPPSAAVAVYRSRFEGNYSSNGGAIKVFGNLTVVDSTFTNNSATGTGGGSSLGGLGGAIEAVGVADNTLCGATIAGNGAGYNGGGYLRISTNMTGGDHWEQSTVTGNYSIGGGGGMYLQDISVDLRRVVVANNNADTVGGIWYVGTTGPFVAENLEVSENTATSGLGAGLSLGTVPGQISFSTFSTNHANCGSCWAAAIDGGGQTLTATVIDGNTSSASGVPVSCRMPLTEGGHNFQWPDDPGALCSPSAQVADARLGPLELRGTYPVAAPLAGSPVIGAATSCPAVDMSGQPRPEPCAAGAVEP